MRWGTCGCMHMSMHARMRAGQCCQKIWSAGGGGQACRHDYHHNHCLQHCFKAGTNHRSPSFMVVGLILHLCRSSRDLAETACGILLENRRPNKRIAFSPSRFAQGVLQSRKRPWVRVGQGAGSPTFLAPAPPPQGASSPSSDIPKSRKLKILLILSHISIIV